MPSESQKIFSVGELNENVHRLISGQLKNIFVKGEISNLSQPASGHVYFSLKEKNAQVRCAFFRNRIHSTNESLKNGLEIIIHGTPSIYTVRGDYQIIVDYLETAGEGLLRRRFEELKQKLRKEGLFESSSKKTIPTLHGSDISTKNLEREHHFKMKTLQNKGFWGPKCAVCENQLLDLEKCIKKLMKKRSPPSMGVIFREKSSSGSKIST